MFTHGSDKSCPSGNTTNPPFFHPSPVCRPHTGHLPVRLRHLHPALGPARGAAEQQPRERAAAALSRHHPLRVTPHHLAQPCGGQRRRQQQSDPRQAAPSERQLGGQRHRPQPLPTTARPCAGRGWEGEEGPDTPQATEGPGPLRQHRTRGRAG